MKTTENMNGKDRIKALIVNLDFQNDESIRSLKAFRTEAK
jgi:hypothetical protein